MNTSGFYSLVIRLNKYKSFLCKLKYSFKYQICLYNNGKPFCTIRRPRKQAKKLMKVWVILNKN